MGRESPPSRTHAPPRYIRPRTRGRSRDPVQSYMKSRDPTQRQELSGGDGRALAIARQKFDPLNGARHNFPLLIRWPTYVS